MLKYWQQNIVMIKTNQLLQIINNIIIIIVMLEHPKCIQTRHMMRKNLLLIY